MNPFSLAAVLVLITGLLSGGAIYFTAGDPEPATSKTYVRQIERFGGKAALLFDDLNRGFARLWRGKTLGLTIGWISVAASLLLLWIARARRGGPP